LSSKQNGLADVSRHRAKRPQAGVEHILQRARNHLIGSPRRALSSANEAVVLADSRGDVANQAAARQVRGDAQRFLGQHEAALVDYAQSGLFYRQLRRSADAARTDASAVDSLRCLGRPAEALRLAARARRVFQRLGEELRSAVLDEIVGLIYFQQDDYTRALRLFDRARPVVAAVGRPLDLAALNNNAATALTSLDRLREAETLYAAARSAYAEQGPMPLLPGSTSTWASWRFGKGATVRPSICCGAPPTSSTHCAICRSRSPRDWISPTRTWRSISWTRRVR
jgi:tetratricopeptide (TPR) repeat protein